MITIQDIKDKKVKLEFGNIDIINAINRDIKERERLQKLNVYDVRIDTKAEIIAEDEEEARQIFIEEQYYSIYVYFKRKFIDK